MTNEFHALLDSMSAQDTRPPPVHELRSQLSIRRNRRLRRRGFVALLAASALVMYSVTFAMDNKELDVVTADTHLPGSDDAQDAGSLASDATGEPDTAESITSGLFGIGWTPIARVGVPETDADESLSFEDDRLSLASCQFMFYSIRWQADGFVVLGEVPPREPVPAIGCDSDASRGVLDTPLSSEVFVNVVRVSSSEIQLSSEGWSLSLVASG